MKAFFQNQPPDEKNTIKNDEQTQWAKSPKKNSLKGCVFANSALKMQCHVVKNTLQK